jgi:hypothetical protein
MKMLGEWIVGLARNSRARFLAALTLLLLAFSFIGVNPRAQSQQSGGGGSNASVGATGATAPSSGTLAGGAFNTSLPTLTNGQMGAVQLDSNGRQIGVGAGVAGTPAGGVFSVQGVASGTALPISGNIGNTAFGASAGTANIGLMRVIPSSCTQSTNFTNATVDVATGAGTTVTSTTTCVTMVYVNNKTNSAVSFRLADKAATPVIWIGGNADFSIPANSNVRFPVDGVTFTSGITAIAGTASALNIQVNGLQ